MSSKKNQFVSISLDTKCVKVALVKSSGQIAKIVKEQVVGADIVSAIKSALRGFNTKGSGVVCVLPSDVATTKNIEVPSTDAKEIASIINLQAGKYTPFSKDEILLGYLTIGSYQENHTKVLLVIVKRDIVKDKLNLLQTAGVEVDSVAVAAEGIAKLYGKSKVKRDRAPIAIIDVDSTKTDFVIESRSTAVMSRSIPVGIVNLTDDTETAKQTLISEIKDTIDTYKSESIDEEISSFILTRGSKILTDLQPELAEALGVDVQIDPFTRTVKASKSIKNDIDHKYSDVSFLEVVAPGAVAVRAEVDLLPDEIRMNRSLEEKSKEATKAGILALITIVFLGVALITKVYFKETFLQTNLIEKYAGQREQVEVLESYIAKTRLVKEYAEKRMVSLDMLNELYRLTPKDVYLGGVNMDENGMVLISGVAESMSRVFSLVTDLEESDMFEAVKTKSTATKKDRGKDAAAFEITFNIEGMSKAVPEETLDDIKVEEE